MNPVQYMRKSIEEESAKMLLVGKEACPTMVAVDKLCEEMWGRDERELESHPKSYKRFHVDIYGNEMCIP